MTVTTPGLYHPGPFLDEALDHAADTCATLEWTHHNGRYALTYQPAPPADGTTKTGPTLEQCAFKLLAELTQPKTNIRR